MPNFTKPKKLNNYMTQKEQVSKLINEVEQLILHAEEGSLDYSVLEHARKLVFQIKQPEEYENTNTNVLSNMRTSS